MAKRFTDTDKWKRPWFAELNLHAKLTWVYLLDDCDHRGVWVANFKRISFDLGFKVTADRLEQWFGAKLVKIEKDKYYLPSFITFQYGDTLNPSNNAHRKILSFLEKYQEKVAPSEGLKSPSSGVQDKDKDKDKDKEEGGLGETKPKKENPLFEIWNHWRGSLPRAISFSPTRKTHAAARFKENPDPEYWAEVVRRMAESDFCTGKNDKGWVADFDFFLRPDTHLKALEGKYQRKPKHSPSTGVDMNL